MFKILDLQVQELLYPISRVQKWDLTFSIHPCLLLTLNFYWSMLNQTQSIVLQQQIKVLHSSSLLKIWLRCYHFSKHSEIQIHIPINQTCNKFDVPSLISPQFIFILSHLSSSFWSPDRDLLAMGSKFLNRSSIDLLLSLLLKFSRCF